jgi:hypothetical protein
MRQLAALYPQEYSWYSFVRGGLDPRAIVWLEGLSQLKNPMTSSELPDTHNPTISENDFITVANLLPSYML